MKTKLTTYQKQKLKIKELEKDIYNLVVNENLEDGVFTKLKYKVSYDIDKLIMCGNEN